MIKTVTLSGEEIGIKDLGGFNTVVHNLSDNVIYASKRPNITAGADNVAEIPAGGAKLISTTNGTVYLLGTGKAELTGQDYEGVNFSSSASGGIFVGTSDVTKKYVDEQDSLNIEAAKSYADSAVDTVKKDISELLSEKADKADIPPSPENMRGATEKAAGKAGLVPAPSAGEAQRFLSADGDWDNPFRPIYVTTPNTSLDNYTASGIYLFGVTYKPTDPPGNSANGFLLVMAYSATAIKQVWFKFAGDDYQTFVRTKADTWTGWSRVITYNDVFKGATDSAGGDRGLVPIPTAGGGHLYLKGSGGWGNPFTPTGTDGTGKSLKSYVTSGLYLFTKSQMPTDPPSANCINGWLWVIATSSTALKQIWFNLAGGNSSGHYTYIRTCDSGTWSDWRKFETVPADVGATIPVIGVVQGDLASLSNGTGRFLAPYMEGASKALVEVWKTDNAFVATTTVEKTIYGSRFMSGISSSMTAIASTSVVGGPDFSISIGTDDTGRVSFYGSINTNAFYRITWFA